jgi:hypothetical protein
MGREFTRKELHELVWSQPMRTVAASVGISDVALAKACRKADIPVPERGYWARKSAGKPTIERSLPPRFPGASDDIEIGGSNRWDPEFQNKLLNEALPPPPTFEEDIAAVVERVRKMVGKVERPKQLMTSPHKLIAVLLKRDDEQRVEFVRTGYSWYAPLYDSPIEKRRLRILNAIFMAAERLGCKADMRTSRYANDKRETSIHVGQQSISFTLDSAVGKPRSPSSGSLKERLRLSISSRQSNPPSLKSWEDSDETSLEDKLTEIIIELIVAAETFHRGNVIRHHEWLVERKAELEKEVRRRKAESERKARELIEKQAKERIDHLLAQANTLHQSDAIRSYVKAALDRSAELAIAGEELDRWVSWALGEADRIDPVKNGAILDSIKSLNEASASAENST